MTVALPEEVVLWAHRRAEELNLSASQYVASLLEREMRAGEQAKIRYEKSKREVLAMRDQKLGSGAANRMSREETHKRR